jgi:hypothetical protein
MFTVEADKANNLLVLTFSRQVGPEEMKRGQDEVNALVAGLAPGFRLLSDMSGLEGMDPACVAYVRKNMDLLNKRGVSAVIRVIPDPHKDIGFNILSLFHYRRGIRIVTCASLEEARAALAG